jgi:hypothetical protein
MRTERLRLLTKRRLMLPLALVAAAVVSLAALGAASDWWFLQDHGRDESKAATRTMPISRPVLGPTPVSAPDVVKQGEWSGHPWHTSRGP